MTRFTIALAAALSFVPSIASSAEVTIDSLYTTDAYAGPFNEPCFKDSDLDVVWQVANQTGEGTKFGRMARTCVFPDSPLGNEILTVFAESMGYDSYEDVPQNRLDWLKLLAYKVERPNHVFIVAPPTPNTGMPPSTAVIPLPAPAFLLIGAIASLFTWKRRK